MKLGILTHPLYGNYGGMLQAYALVKALRDCGHEAYNLDFEPRCYRAVLHSPFKRAKERFRGFLLEHNLAFSHFKMPHLLQIEMGQHFAKKYVPSLSLEKNPARRLQEHGIEAVVVGSDQVWRGSYARAMKSFPYFFLDFAPLDIRKSSVSYAASFGTDAWDGTDEEAEACGRLLQDFRAVSVREESGAGICRQICGKTATRVADPTLLLYADDYNSIISHEQTWEPESAYIATYILDASPHISAAVQAVSATCNLTVQPLKADTKAARKRDRLPISVAQWLKLIRDSECLITDSFHGCVFAIIFNKPFVCLGNKERGTARFESLLSTYNLENRIVSEISSAAIQRVLNIPVDWELVNNIHDCERVNALGFIHSNLH